MEPNGRSVLFQHGAMMDATLWVTNSPFSQGDATGVPAFFKLADEGYDVWLGNNRATRYSNENSRYPKADEKQGEEYSYPAQYREKYNTSWQEMGKYDVPAMLDKIIEESGNESVSYVGYSQGTSQLFYGLATDQDKYAKRIDRAIMLAPCVVTLPMFQIEDHMKFFPVLRQEGIFLFNNDNVGEDKKHEKLCRKVNYLDAFSQEYYDFACENYKGFVTELETLPVKSLELYN